MSLSLALATYFICWWLVLFAVLPFGVRTQAEEGEVEPGTPASAPAVPMLARKLIVTTIVASFFFAVVYAVLVYKIITLDDIPFLPRFDDLS